ncbi:MAG: carbohydrate ABC transporter permease [Treponema sp.]
MTNIKTKIKAADVIAKFAKYILLVLATLIVVLPILVIFLGSFKTGEEFNRSKPFDLPKFVVNTEVWKGGQIISKDSPLFISSNVLENHKMKSITLVFDEIENKDSSVDILNSKKEIVYSSDLSLSSDEITIPVDEKVSENLLKEGFYVSGNDYVVRRVKTMEGFLFENYITAFTKGKMLLGFLNTFIIIFFVAIGTVLTGSMTAYILSRFRFKLWKFVYTMFLWIALIPAITTQVATFQIIQKLGLYNTRLSVIILSMGTDIISIMIYIQFLNSISTSLDESAIIDGANYWQVFFKIILPLLQPATVTVLILKCVNVYNDFYNPLLYMPKSSLAVISTSLYKFKGPFGTNWPVICAGVIIAVIPTLIIFLCAQKYIYNGMVSGSVKE